MFKGKTSQGSRGSRIVFRALAALSAVLLIGGAATAITTVRTFAVPSTSMADTVRPGDTVVVDRTEQIQRGDVIVEQQPLSGVEYNYIRRVIGLPGDHVLCCDARGRITVNGKPLNETYLYPGDVPSLHRFNVTVPAGKLWLLGDRRSIALDSRIEGPLDARVVGRVFLIIRSSHPIFLSTPRTFAADGLAPAGDQVPPALVGLGVFGLGVVVLFALAIFGMIRYAIWRRARSHLSEPVPQSWDHTATQG
jgi:signal peptidase I